MKRGRGPAAFRDLRRLVDGVALIAMEAAKRSPNFEGLAKGAVLAATDLAGLTKGNIRLLSNPNNAPTTHHHLLPSSSSSPSSVVYFSHAEQQQQQPVKDGKILRQEEDKQEFITSLGSAEATTGSADSCSANTYAEKQEQVVVEEDAEKLKDRGSSAGQADDHAAATVPPAGAISKRRLPRERKVPSTPFTRALGFAGLGAGLAWGTLQESARRIMYGSPETDGKPYSPFLSEKNAERLALSLCRMRGAALKIGQMLSIQDESLVPPPILTALEIVRQGADVMPRKQLNAVLDAELGLDWSLKLRSFDYEPLAAASIGQVHRVVMKDSLEVAMKIQYPGVADSIESDIENVRLLLNYTNLIPKGLFLDRAIKVAKEELARECDYLLEAQNQRRFRELLLTDSEGFYVPRVIDELSSRKVLTTELVPGIPIDKVALSSQETRNYVGRKLLELTLKELFVFRFMQTDPNWSNFLYDEHTNMFNLIDFGAARDYPKSFVDDYLRMVVACANCNRDGVIEMSRRLGFITGEESEVMLDAHVQAAFIVGIPFSKAGGYDFQANNMTHSVTNLGATMLKHRLTPPPDEAYSLHRKLSGAFLACIKLGAVVPCRELLLQVYEQYEFSSDNAELLTGLA